MHSPKANPSGDRLNAPPEPGARYRDELNHVLLAVARGDRTSFATLYRQTSAKLFGICLKMLRDRGEAEEVLQDVYITVWQRAATFDPGLSSAITWLAAIARNRAIDRLRRQRPEHLDELAGEAIADEAPTPATLAERSQERQRLERCLQALPERHGEFVREAFYRGTTYVELATRLSVPLGTMKSWIRRSLMQLKTCLER
ncbi:sigma-70 family RNA polymerase sigma factor [Paraburkholderia sp. CNPSo 3272]|uniref:sigma-70 family RNA polymerase sigma factor n=1 Tax=Paraburkholderia sp. CNPSo 3272 TaxID=2940931 RepID=UPI0020B78FD9|nr:sigma-70 family RNA polymerase sigma factor [Paraburkholderia sp. CNPSo 3272]MCP3722407.1 sigma-70 family RNA polymerase sigma factor [Paraburkholderia sp. CNPSo 3272]